MPDTTILNAQAAIAQADWPTCLGSDLLALVKQCDPPVQSVEPLANLDAPSHRSAAFCLHLADDSAIKGRKTWDEERARRICYFLSHLESQGFPKVIARHGSALLLEWVTGRTQDNSAGNAIVRPCGQLLGRLHCTPLPTDCPYILDTRIDTLTAGIEDGLRKLRDNGAITAATSQAILRVVADSQPRDAETGIIHTDLCPANLVLTDEGHVRPVDNESLQVGYLELDLARSWYRWPLNRVSGAEFLTAYGAHRDATAFRKHFAFWFIKVLIDSALYRLGSPSGAWRTPVSRLLGFIDQPYLEMCEVCHD